MIRFRLTYNVMVRTVWGFTLHFKHRCYEIRVLTNTRLSLKICKFNWIRKASRYFARPYIARYVNMMVTTESRVCCLSVQHSNCNLFFSMIKGETAKCEYLVFLHLTCNTQVCPFYCKQHQCIRKLFNRQMLLIFINILKVMKNVFELNPTPYTHVTHIKYITLKQSTSVFKPKPIKLGF